MESITETQWDVLIAGTGLPQSLLALALSRIADKKKILHVDANEYYGGTDAALSLQDAEAWMIHMNADKSASFRGVKIETPQSDGDEERATVPKLGFSRAYSLALSPAIIYARSVLLPTLVSSKTHRQLEFLAVGSWFVYEKTIEDENGMEGELRKIPNSREDIFADRHLDMKSKRSLITFLRTIRDPDAEAKAVEEYGKQSLKDYISERFGLSEQLQEAVNALTLSLEPPSRTTVEYAIPRVLRHLSSIGALGPGWGAVVPKWGGLAEIAQVACRAQAVGGGVYMLGKGIKHITSTTGSETSHANLADGSKIKFNNIAGTAADIPGQVQDTHASANSVQGIHIIGSSLDGLFMTSTEGGPKPAVAIVYFPAGTFEGGPWNPVYLMVHSSDLGECPTGQCVIYSNLLMPLSTGREYLHWAVAALLDVYGQTDELVLWSMVWDRPHPVKAKFTSETSPGTGLVNLHVFNETSQDLAFDDSVLQVVEQAWQSIMGEHEGFMQFEDREIGAYDDEEVDDGP